MPDTDSVTLVTKFTYRGAPEEWSNTYHLDGTTPTTAAEWKTLTDAMIAAFKPCIPNFHTVVKAYGYVAGNDNSVYQRDLTIAPDAVVVGTFAGGGAFPGGDAAGVLRWTTPNFTSRGKRIYLRKFFHGVMQLGTGTGDSIDTTQRAAYNTFGAKMIDGTLPGGMVLVGPQGAAASNPFASPWITTRTLKRRGKRPPTT